MNERALLRKPCVISDSLAALSGGLSFLLQLFIKGVRYDKESGVS